MIRDPMHHTVIYRQTKIRRESFISLKSSNQIPFIKPSLSQLLKFQKRHSSLSMFLKIVEMLIEIFTRISDIPDLFRSFDQIFYHFLIQKNKHKWEDNTLMSTCRTESTSSSLRTIYLIKSIKKLTINLDLNLRDLNSSILCHSPIMRSKL